MLLMSVKQAVLVSMCVWRAGSFGVWCALTRGSTESMC